MSNNTYENDIHSCTSSGRRPTRTTKAFDEDPAAIVEQEFWQPLLPHEVTAALQQLEDYLLHASHLKSSEKTFLCFARGQSTMAVGKRGAWTYEIDEDSLRYLTSEGFGITELAQISGGSKGCLRADLVEVIIGASGLIGVRHLEHILAEEEAELKAIIDPAPAGIRLAEENKVPYYDSVDSFLAAREDDKVSAQAAILCTPTHTHVPLALKLVNVGIHTLVEKPFAVDSVSGRELIAAAQSKARIITGHHRRFHPQCAVIKKLVESGKLGTLIAVSGIWAVYKPMVYYNIPWRQQLGSGGPVRNS
ncbi:MAG: hypothetical protein CYPHOPRED_002269 [Cyphobasidiales sp. Tagirdzhanova-0007]|nr:MAG: hypothetical protein CYPHOPRED_002269 [Cyphobasidiales sp. Tagirdzhanova-0007]